MTRTLRFTALYAVPAAVGLLTLFHPIYPSITDMVTAPAIQVNWFVTLHLLNLELFALLGLTIYLLLDGVHDRAATLSRVALLIFAPVYAGFDAYVGLATGALARHAAGLPPAEQAIASRAADVIWSGAVGNALAVTGSLAWVVALMAAAAALTAPGRRVLFAAVGFVATSAAAWATGNEGLNSPIGWAIVAASAVVMFLAARPAVQPVLLALAGLLFGASHVAPLGPLAMLCLLGAVALRQTAPAAGIVRAAAVTATPGAD
jgi:hypothetical protein